MVVGAQAVAFTAHESVHLFSMTANMFILKLGCLFSGYLGIEEMAYRGSLTLTLERSVMMAEDVLASPPRI